ncbi:hypothetical protein J4G33_06155 [Actinotalea sp. BY-33]|uniref:Uncharacterized protein n=1 Tax=Actinotalea soli TaxID=2819234 RepID=A0A939LU68_9CELL|nr:hypothetical protein [Actinotalea soli]MBO1751382.1 hypothetical protein [Actinotalea soli]
MAQHPRHRFRLLATVLLVALTSTACSAGGDPAPTRPTGEARADAGGSEVERSEATTTRPAGPEQASDGNPSPDANALARAAGSRLAAELGEGIDVGDVPLTAEEVATLRADRTDLGAVGATYLFLMAWRQALASGDPEHLRTLAAPGCSYCVTEADRTDGAPVAGSAEVSLVAWRLSEALPDGTYPHHRVQVGVSVLVWEPSTDGSTAARVTHLDDRDLTIALSLTEAGWQVEGVASAPWAG